MNKVPLWAAAKEVAKMPKTAGLCPLLNSWRGFRLALGDRLMKRIFKNKIVLIIVILTVSISVIAGVINAMRTRSTFVENVAMVTITPVQNAFSWLGGKISGFFGYFGSFDELKAENEELKSENRKLSQKIRQNEGITRENKELRSLLELSEAYPSLSLKAAEVVSRSASNWYENFTIDKGTADGLKIGQGVITVDNVLIGRISDIGSTWARVTTITDPSHSAGAQVIRSGEPGVIEGDSELSENGCLRLSFLSKSSDIVIGDYIETSGLGGVYPKGLEIGKVIEIKPDVQGISQYAVIKTSVNINSVSKVMVITDNISKD